MTSHPVPSPQTFLGRRLGVVPDRAAVISAGHHAFRRNKKPSGDDPSERALVDAGIFFAVGSAANINGVVRFGDHYEGRAATSVVVCDEVSRKANSTDRSASALAEAARRSQRFLLAGGRVERKELDPIASAVLMQSVQDQLVNLDEAQRGTRDSTGHNVVKHAGEAELIVLAVTERIGTLLTNDAGASVVAASQRPSIRALNFADVLMELVCASRGEIDAATARVTFDQACEISAITATAKPQNPARFFSCGQIGGPGSACARCA